MPIKPANRALYPGGSPTSKEWRAIRGDTLQRARHRCQGCGVFNHAWGWRGPTGAFHPILKRLPREAIRRDIRPPFNWHDQGASRHIIEIVLTIGHVDHDPGNNDPSNLRAWCQQCHNRHDLAHRQHTRRYGLNPAAGDLFKG